MAEPIELETLRDLVSSGVVHTVTVLATDPSRELTTQDEYDEWFRERVEEALRDEAEGTLQWHSHAYVWAKVTKAAEAVVAEREARYALTKEGKSSRPKGIQAHTVTEA
jgi:hypothetical protein